MNARNRRYNPAGRKKGFLVLGLLGLMMLVSHQNCAPTESMTSITAQAGIVQDSGSPVSIIDESKTVAGLKFPFGQIELASGAGAVTLLGDCTKLQEGAILNWRLYELSDNGSLGALISQGKASCSDEHFSVPVATGGLVCGRKHKAIAQLGFGVPGEVILNKPCSY